ncbi:recombinase family protein [Streptomyces sp. NPDC005492]|uniref:recombinase family protein n=1 Tax=Streptomyces sp. NPDC005492 TaxID=3156883 RepID=UPI0033B332F1
MTLTTTRISTKVAIRTAREYLRVSKGKGRTARSITDQHRDNIATEKEHGPWTWGPAYLDTGSASKYAKKTRDDFDQLMADLESGAFGKPGDVLVLWEISRLSREMGVGTRIVELSARGAYLIHITSEGESGRTYDPRNYADRHALQAGINDAEREAGRLSARTLRGVNSAASEGRPHGRIPFGYAREYEVIDGRPRCVRQFPAPVDGKLMAELFVRAAGVRDNRLGDESVALMYTNPAGGDALPEPVYAIAQGWAERGIANASGKSFHDGNLREMLTRPTYAGLREHNGVLVPMQWEGYEPIVSRELFDRVQRLFADPSRRTYLDSGVQHVLTAALLCDPCSGPITVRCRKAGVPGYECAKKGCVRVDKAEVDQIIIGDLELTDPETGEALPPKLGVILAYLSAPHRVARLRERPADGPEEKATRTELATLRDELEELETAPQPKTARARIQRTTDMEELEQDIAVLEAKLTKLTTPAPLGGILPDDPSADLVAWWKASDIHRQRAVAALLLTPELLGQVRITPSQGWRDPVTDRLTWLTAA